eukprot:612440-Prymnesium_polylepis.1
MGVVGIIARGDGQSTQTMTNEKGLHPEAFKRTIPAGGRFHEAGHFAFAGTPYLFEPFCAQAHICAHPGRLAALRELAVTLGTPLPWRLGTFLPTRYTYHSAVETSETSV